MSRPRDWIKSDKMDSLLKSLKTLTEHDVLVGIPDDTAERQNDEDAENPQMNNATLGYVHEHGSPARNIPARPFLIPGVEDAQDEITERFKKAAQAGLDGKADKVAAQMNAAGMVAEMSVKAKLDDGDFAPLAPSTVANRRRSRGTKSRRAAEKEYMELIRSGAQAAGMSLEEIQAAAGIKPLINTAQMRNSIKYVIR